MGLVALCEPLPRRPIIAKNAARRLRLRASLLMPQRPLYLHVVLPNRAFPLPLTFTKGDTFSPSTDRTRRSSSDRSLSRFNRKTKKNSRLLLHQRRIVPSHSSHRSFASLLTSIFHTFPITRSRHYAAHFLTHKAPTYQHVKMFTASASPPHLSPRISLREYSAPIAGP